MTTIHFDSIEIERSPHDADRFMVHFVLHGKRVHHVGHDTPTPFTVSKGGSMFICVNDGTITL